MLTPGKKLISISALGRFCKVDCATLVLMRVPFCSNIGRWAVTTTSPNWLVAGVKTMVPKLLPEGVNTTVWYSKCVILITTFLPSAALGSSKTPRWLLIAPFTRVESGRVIRSTLAALTGFFSVFNKVPLKEDCAKPFTVTANSSDRIIFFIVCMVFGY